MTVQKNGVQGAPRFALRLISHILPKVFLILALMTTACEPRKQADQTVDETSSFYEDQVTVTHAKGFSVRYFNRFKLLDIISPFGQGADTARYLLVERGAKRPEGYSDRQLIEIPIRSMVGTSSMHIGLIGFLDAENILTGLADTRYVYSYKVRDLIKAGKVAEIGKNGGVNQEKLITLQPDLLMTTGFPGVKNEQYPALKAAGTAILSNSEWGESTPLARAEWVKLLAVLLNKEKLVNEKLEKVVDEYVKLQKVASQATTKPSVLSGLNMKDLWYLPSGQNYMATFFTDAGGQYPWIKEAGNGSFSLNFEAIYPSAIAAEVWMNVGFGPTDTRQSILESDRRYGDFKAFKSGNMFSYTNRVNDTGCNDFFESGMMEPHVILADMIKILHPDLLPGHQLVYYRKLP